MAGSGPTTSTLRKKRKVKQAQGSAAAPKNKGGRKPKKKSFNFHPKLPSAEIDPKAGTEDIDEFSETEDDIVADASPQEAINQVPLAVTKDVKP